MAIFAGICAIEIPDDKFGNTYVHRALTDSALDFSYTSVVNNQWYDLNLSTIVGSDVAKKALINWGLVFSGTSGSIYFRRKGDSANAHAAGNSFNHSGENKGQISMGVSTDKIVQFKVNAAGTVSNIGISIQGYDKG